MSLKTKLVYTKERKKTALSVSCFAVWMTWICGSSAHGQYPFRIIELRFCTRNGYLG